MPRSRPRDRARSADTAPLGRAEWLQREFHQSCARDALLFSKIVQQKFEQMRRRERMHKKPTRELPRKNNYSSSYWSPFFYLATSASSCEKGRTLLVRPSFRTKPQAVRMPTLNPTVPPGCRPIRGPGSPPPHPE